MFSLRGTIGTYFIAMRYILPKKEGRLSIVESHGIFMELVTVCMTTLLSIIALFLIGKVIGHKQLAQFDFFDYISGITIGSIAAELATELEDPLQPLLALLIYGAVSVVLGFLTRRFPRTRKYINGTPSILMDCGKIYRKNLRKAKLDLTEFQLLCREQGYFDLTQIETAVFEQNGKLSILPCSRARPLTPEDMALTPAPEGIGVELIMDGKLLAENLHRIGRDQIWLDRALHAQGYSDSKRILLGVYYDKDDRLVLFPLK